MKQREIHWSCVADGTSYLFPQWDDHNKTSREQLVLSRSRDQFPISPVRLPQWNKQRVIGPVSLTGPVAYFPSEMTKLNQTESHWFYVTHGTSFLFLQWDDHNETNREPLVLRRLWDQFPISPVRWPKWKKKKIKKTKQKNREPLVLCRSRDLFPISPVRWPQ